MEYTDILRKYFCLAFISITGIIQAQDCYKNINWSDRNFVTDATISAKEIININNLDISGGSEVRLTAPEIYVTGMINIEDGSKLIYTEDACGPLITVDYIGSDEDFANPERGFYTYSETRAGNYNLLNQGTLEYYRDGQAPWNASDDIKSTLVYRYFFLEDFTAGPIRQGYLDSIQMDMDIVRNAGVKIIPRFAYTDEVNSDGCNSWICPPYGDAPKNIVLDHIDQLAPILESNKDVIAFVQMGFIGVWGENYYTDHFGDASLAPFVIQDNFWLDRIEVLDKLLDVVPKERMVQVRYPQMKQRYLGGVNAPTSSPAMTEAEAFTKTKKSRIGFHNDCLLSGPDDIGTYYNFGNSSSFAISDTANLKPYFAQESRYVVAGGETCESSFDPENDCASSNVNAYGDKELERMHYSYINSQYYLNTINDWGTGGCLGDIQRRLGYRLELQKTWMNEEVKVGNSIDFGLSIKNKGYAGMYNERKAYIVLKNGTEEWKAPITGDLRDWYASVDAYTVAETFCIPSNMPQGTYEVHLSLPDAELSIQDDPRYAVRLANGLQGGGDVWNDVTGYNSLGRTLVIDGSTTTTTCNGEVSFQKVN